VKTTFVNGAKNIKKGGYLLRQRIGLRFHFIDTVKKAYWGAFTSAPSSTKAA